MGKRKRMKHFKVTNYGVYDEVTGTSVMLEVDGLKILFDYGLYQSNLLDAKQIIEANWKAKKDIPLEEIDYVIVTHAHADHSGGLPMLFRPDSPFRGKVLCTEPSAPLISMICCDSSFVQQNQIKAYLKKHPKQELYPNYTTQDAEQVILHLQGYGYNEKVWLNDRVSIEFLPNGHLFGSASIYLEFMVDEYETATLLFTGDYNYNPKIPRPFTKEWDKDRILDVDVLITEATYGDKLHEWIEPEFELEDYVLSEVIDKRKVLLLPAFAVSRSTQLLSMVKHIYDKNPILTKRKVPVYLVGRMTQQAHRTLGNEYYKKHYVDDRWLPDYDVFNWGRVNKIEKFQEVEEKLIDSQPKIIIVSGGMGCGHSLFLLQQLCDKPWCSILGSGYAGIGTPMRAINDAAAENRKQVSLQGKTRMLNADVLPPLEMSGHADYQQMCQLITRGINQKRLKNIIIIHGDENSKNNLKNEILKRKREEDITIDIPKPKQSLQL